MKQRISLCFSMFILLLLCPLTMMAENFKYNYRGVTFYCNVSSNKVSIVAFDRKVAQVVIPAKVESPSGQIYDVTHISLSNDNYSYSTTEVAIEKGIKYIDDYCFYDFKNLKNLYVPSTIERFGKKAFNAKHFPKLTMDPDFASRFKEVDLQKGLVVTTLTHISSQNAMDYIALEDYGMSSNKKKSESKKDSKSKKEKSISTEPKGIIAGTSDVDYDIPNSRGKRENTFCVIIANENYDNAPSLNYAKVDGETFAKYCTNTLGIPDDNIRTVYDGSYIEMRDQLDWLINISKVFDNDARYIVYYSGHGIAGEDGSCYMLPVEGNPNKSTHGFSIKDLSKKLQEITSGNANALVLMDACYSGTDRHNVSILDGEKRGMVKVKEEEFKGNVIMMSAVTDTQTSMSYDDKGHGMFTYFLLKKLQETKGDVTFGELFDYIHKQVSRRSVIINNKPQTPSLNISDALNNTWRNMKF